MSSFLKFLNTADVDELRKLPGIGAALAKNIVSARPFSTDDDVFRVKGLDEKLLVKLQAAYFEQFQAAAEAAGTTAANVAIPALEGKAPMDGRDARGRASGFWGRLGRALMNLVRIFLWFMVFLAVVGGIGAAAYFGIPYLYVRFVQPVELNALRIQQVATQQAADLATTGAEVSELRSRLASLEARSGAIESTVAAHSATIGQLEQLQAAFATAMVDQHTELVAELDYQVKLARAVEYLSRSRLYLSQSNFGLARQDVLSARNLLADLQDATPSDQIASMRAVIARLDLALGNLPGYPVIAAEDLEIAWQVLIDGLPAGGEALATPLRVYPTPAPTATETPLPPPAPTATPIDTPTTGG